jgi:hypothetical protein
VKRHPRFCFPKVTDVSAEGQGDAEFERTLSQMLIQLCEESRNRSGLPSLTPSQRTRIARAAKNPWDGHLTTDGTVSFTVRKRQRRSDWHNVLQHLRERHDWHERMALSECLTSIRNAAVLPQ